MLGLMAPSAETTFLDDFTSLSFRNTVPAGVNKIRNSEAFNAGLVTGLTDINDNDRGRKSGMPENWTMYTSGGLSLDVTAVGTALINGQSQRTVTFRLHGTGGATTYLGFEASYVIRAAAADSWTGSVYLALASGGTSLTNISNVVVSPDGWTDAPAFVNGGWSDVTTSLTTTLSRFPASFTAQTGVNWVKHSLTIFSATGNVDFYFTVCAPQMEKSAAATTYVPTTSDSGTWNSCMPWGPTVTVTNEQQYYPDVTATGTLFSQGIYPFSISNSILTITGSKPVSGTLPQSFDGKTRTYVSGCLTSHRRFDQRYGYFESRMKWSGGQGIWPAFWMIPPSNSAVPNGRQEIDILEWAGTNIDPADNTVMFNLHSGTTSAPYDYGTNANLPAGDMHVNYHTYGVDYRADKIVYYLDRKAVGTGVATPSDMTQPMYLMFNLALGGDWAGNIVENGQLPATLQIDYVRVWDRLPF